MRTLTIILAILSGFLILEVTDSNGFKNLHEVAGRNIEISSGGLQIDIAGIARDLKCLEIGNCIDDEPKFPMPRIEERTEETVKKYKI